MVRTLYITVCACMIGIAALAQPAILWKVKNAGSSHTSYLLGTYHYIGNSFVDSLPAIRNSIRSSGVAVFESLAGKDEITQLLNKRPDDFSYKEHLKPADRSLLTKISAGWNVPLSKLTPMLIVLKLQQTYYETQCGMVKPTDTWKHMDSYLRHIAGVEGLQLVGLETDSQMYRMLNALPSADDWSVMQKPIHTWLLNIEKERNRKSLCKDGIDYMNFAFDYQLDKPCGDNPLVKDRNEQWLDHLSTLLQSNNCFIAVGLLHLYGDCGLITQLRQQGYSVEPVTDLRNPGKG